jgi:Carboxypeptidase regulatory-like domain
MRKLIGRIFPLLFILLMATQLRAQEVAAITGVITDPAGAVIPGVTVTLQNPQTGATYNAVGNAEGSYTLNEVKPGPGYKISFSKDGFKPEVITGIYMNVDSTRTQNVKMSVGNVAQTVVVSASNQDVTLDTTDATVGNNFQVQFLNDLPIEDRSNPSALFTQQPGVTLDGAVTGARTDQNNVTLDGLEVNDNATGQFGAIVGNAPVDSVQEFRGVTAGPLSSAGQGGGGQYELVTRSGTNKFHGALVEYHRDTDTEANDWFNNDESPVVPRPPLIRNQFGGNIGGPIKKDKAFFFFDWNSRRDTLSNLEERTVPMDAFRAGEVSYCNNTSTPTQCAVETLTAAQVKAIDPLGVGFDAPLQTVLSTRYPEPNDLSGNYGDLINTAGFRFDAPFPYVENDYVARVDYNLTANQRLFGRGTVAKENATQAAIQFPGDPETYPFLNDSYAWVVGHTWTIGSNKTNQVDYGETLEDYAFPNTYNPTGITQYGFGGIPSGGTFMTAPYASAINAQSRTFPIPVIRDDFTWEKGKHSLTFGGTFKYENPASNTVLDYNSPTVGLGGHLSNLNTATGQPSLRPSDLASDAASIASYDSEYTFGLGRYAAVSSTFNYNNQGNPLPQGTGSSADYRYYETEVYFGDTWKVTPSLTLSYGVRWQNYTVPYEVHGIESLPNLNFEQLFGARVAQSAAGAYGPSTDCNPTLGAGVPCVNYVLGGKGNNAPGYFQPVYKDVAPRIAFAYSPSYDRKSVFSGGAGIIYDHTVVNAIQYQASQYSYLFQSSATLPFGVASDPISSLKNDPRFSGFSTPPPPPTAPAAISAPYTPFVSGGVPFGLGNGSAFNEGVDNNLKTPYSIQYDFGFQHEFPQGFLLKTTYVGRLGRRLLGQADADQLIDFPDAKSGQMMSQAFANLSKQVRSNPNYYLGAGSGSVTPQPWFEDLLPAGAGNDFGVPSNTAILSTYLGTLAYRGDFADTIQALSGIQEDYGLGLPDNVGMGSQFSEFTYYTNQGFSSYNGMLVTLHKNLGQGLQFDLNYTWAHSIDNVSVIANAPAIGGYGFICDVLRQRECRGKSDFDVKSYLNGNFVYELPFGRGQALAATAPLWANEFIGGWEISGLPNWHTGTAYFAESNAFVAGYANEAPALMTGPISDLKMHIHKDSSGTVWAYKSDNAPATSDYTGPLGFNIGSRNNLRGPEYFDLDLGLGKTFPIVGDNLKLKFRCDAFNALNHPSFNTPSNDITQSSVRFGVISSTASTARVLQLALRLEF